MVKSIPPKRIPYDQRREREYLYPEEIDSILAAAKTVSRYPHRDYTLLLVMYRHGLRVSELCNLKWADVDFKTAHLVCRRAKGGKDSNQPISGTELRALRKLQRDYLGSPWLFVSERKAPLTPATVRKIVDKASKAAGISFPVHPHMFRHSCGYALTTKGMDIQMLQDYLGHQSPQCTTLYTHLAPGRFKDFWSD